MIPITLVTGFLGSGKTSLIAHILDNTPDRTVAVVVNDMAPRSIDCVYLRGGEFLQTGSDDLIRAIPGGRVGAGKLETLLEEILSLLDQDHKPEAILVETSGGSPALVLAETLENEPRLAGRARLDSIITVVDTSEFPRWWSDPLLRPVLEDQIRAADLVILNKYDRAGFFGRLRTRMTVRVLHRAAPVILAEFGRIDPEEVLNTGRHEGKTRPDRRHRSNPNHYPLVARQLEEVRPFHPERLHLWLSQDWPGMIRVKGFLWLATDMDHVYVVDSIGSLRELGMEGTWYGAIPPEDVPDDPAVQSALQAGPHGDRRQSITVIGTPEAVEREMRNLRSALLSATELDRGPRGWRDLPDPIQPQFTETETEE
ncbi:MAG: GTP-binding protein [Spirochaetaceae bacterium]|nr:MAG: GTP-binding protein [Spirochaetaceae bacterium]